MNISDQELERQLQELMRGHETTQTPATTKSQLVQQRQLQRQLQQMQAQVEKQMKQEEAKAKANANAKAKVERQQKEKEPPASMTRYVTNLLSYLSVSFPVFLDTVLKSMGYAKPTTRPRLTTAPMRTTSSKSMKPVLKTKPRTPTPHKMVVTMDKYFRQIKKDTEEVLAHPRATRKTLENTITVLTTILQTTPPPRYRGGFEALRKRAVAKLATM